MGAGFDLALGVGRCRRRGGDALGGELAEGLEGVGVGILGEDSETLEGLGVAGFGCLLVMVDSFVEIRREPFAVFMHAAQFPVGVAEREVAVGVFDGFAEPVGGLFVVERSSAAVEMAEGGEVFGGFAVAFCEAVEDLEGVAPACGLEVGETPPVEAGEAHVGFEDA